MKDRHDRPLRFAGYAAIFNRADAARDTILPGAFARSLCEHLQSYPLYWQHKPEQQIGVVERIEEDGRGLRVIGRVDNPQGRVAQMLRRKQVDGLSFGYRARSSRYEPQGRILIDIDLFEISLVTHPLQASARVHLVD